MLGDRKLPSKVIEVEMMEESASCGNKCKEMRIDHEVCGLVGKHSSVYVEALSGI